jgi:hypothetical protein
MKRCSAHHADHNGVAVMGENADNHEKPRSVPQQVFPLPTMHGHEGRGTGAATTAALSTTIGKKGPLQRRLYDVMFHSLQEKISMTDAQATELLAQLSEHYREPVRPVSVYCDAFDTWASCL